MRIIVKILSFALLGIFELSAKTTLEWTEPDHKIISEYLNIHDAFFKKHCAGGADHLYFKYHKEYLGDGLFIPTLKQDKLLDIEAIKFGVPEIQKKLDWIGMQIKNLQQENKEVINVQEDLLEIKKRIKTLLELKGKLYSRLKAKRKYSTLLSSRIEFKKLYKNFQLLLQKIPFLLNYKFPVDHFTYRKRYDIYKEKDNLKSTKLKNIIFMHRKILEDGAQNPNRSQNDLSLRALLSTIMLRLQMDNDFITEDLRYDLNSLIPMLEKQLKYTKEEQISRMTEWQQRTQKAYSYYENLIPKKAKKGEKETVLKNIEEILNKTSNSKARLKDYNLSKQKDTFIFWMKQSELMQALYALETILMNEVGDIDGRDALERKDVINVVINRKDDPKFSKISSNDGIFPYLQELGEENIWKNTWLNILFKEGEFSFTYYFIPSSVRIYCPDMSRIGVFLRKENLKFSLDILKNPNYDFKAVRYFSRHSMLGRIDMSTLWYEYLPLPERPGNFAKHTRLLKRAYESKEYTYLYSFRNQQKTKKYHVLEFNIHDQPQVYVLSREENNINFYQYRNPHYFKYFKKK